MRLPRFSTDDLLNTDDASNVEVPEENLEKSDDQDKVQSNNFIGSLLDGQGRMLHRI